MSIRMICAMGAVVMVAGCAQMADNSTESPSFVAASLGYDAYKAGDLVKAEEQFEAALAAEPDNPYALLGLGAVRENTGDIEGARWLYAAAGGAGQSAPANYTYITEQRLERAANLNVASLARENLNRLDVQQAALTAPVPDADTGFVSYDEAPVPAPASYSETVSADPALQGNYQQVGSYDSYVASLSGTTIDTTTSVAVDDSFYGALSYGDESIAPATVIGAADYSDTVEGIEAATYTETVTYSDDSTPYYQESLSAYTGEASGPVSYAPVQTLEANPAGPVGGVIGYGDAIGGQASDVGGRVFLQ